MSWLGKMTVYQHKRFNIWYKRYGLTKQREDWLRNLTRTQLETVAIMCRLAYAAGIRDANTCESNSNQPKKFSGLKVTAVYIDEATGE